MMELLQARCSGKERLQNSRLECAKRWKGSYCGSVLSEPVLRNQPIMESLSPRVRTALAFVEKQYADPKLRLDSVAEHVRVSSHHLSSLIKKETGKGFRHHLIHVRLQAARFYLTRSFMSVKEIATLVGYGSTSSFDREFRRNFECSPTEVRRQDQDGPSRAILLDLLSGEGVDRAEIVNQSV